MKRVLSFVFVLALGLTGLQVHAQTIFSAVSPSYHTLYYRVVNRDIPQVEVCNPTNLGDWWGSGWNNYSTPYGRVTIPATVSWQDTTWSVVRIGNCAFAGCSGILGVTLPDGIDSIKGYGFFNTQIDTINIPSSVVYIGNSNFQSPRLHHVTLPVGLLYFDKWEQCGASILDFTIEEGNPYYRTLDGCLVYCTNDIVELVAYPRGRNHGVVELPEGLTRIDWQASVGSGHKLIIPSTMRYIHENSFSFDTLIFRGLMPPQVGNTYMSNIQCIELPCGAQQRYAATSWGQYVNFFVTGNYLYQENYQQTINYGNSYTWDGHTITERGVYEDTLLSVVEGCDSVHRVLTLNIQQFFRTDTVLIDGQSVDFHGLTIGRPGVYEVLVPSTGDFDSLFVLRASAQVNATVATVLLGGLMDGVTLTLPAMESQVFAHGEDTIIVTNIHQIILATVDTTIAEGESYRGHTMAGVYVDTTYFTDYDSIVCSCISMFINRFDGTVQLSSNHTGWWKDTCDNVVATSSQCTTVVPPMQSRRYVLQKRRNLLTDGDFEQGGTWFTSHTGYTSNTAYNGHYEILQGRGVDSSYGVTMDGATVSNVYFYFDTLMLEIGHTYEFSYDMYPRNGNPPTIQITLGNTVYSDYLANNEMWQHFTHQYIATGEVTYLKMIDLSTEYWGNDFDLDNLSLVDVSPGLYTDTITVTNRHQLVYDTTRVDLCQGNSYTVDGIDYSTTGTYTLPTQYYTDSTVYPTLALDVHNNYYPQLSAQVCEGENYNFGSLTLTETGVYVDSLQSLYDCDSLVTLTLSVYNHTTSTQTEDVCDSYQWHGTVYTASALMTDTLVNAHGCDSVCTLNLTVRYSSTGDTVANVCDLFTWYGQAYTTSGTPTHILTNVAGCDSTLTLNLTVRYSTTGSETMVVCDSVTWQGVLHSTSGDYVETLTNVVGCDSTATLHLTVNSTYQHTDAVFACDNQLPYLYHEQPLMSAGDYAVHFQSVENCDSTVTVTLTVGTTYQHTDQLTLCQSGMPYNYGVMTFVEDDTTGTHTVPFSTVEGCDSIISLNLTVHESEQTEIYVVTVQNHKNLVLWQPEAVVESYRIYREGTASGTYEMVAEVPFHEGGSWLDDGSDARSRSYRYRMTSVDSCGVESDYSSIHKTMHLTINQGQGNSWNLVWTEYEGTTYSTYRIYRGTSYYNLQLIDEMPAGGNTTYTDNNAPWGTVYYQIVVLLTSQGTKDGNDGTIRSNVATNGQTAIPEVDDNSSVIVRMVDGMIVVDGAEGNTVWLYDVNGRVLATKQDEYLPIHFDVPASCAYLIKIGNHPARKVVVIR